VKKEDFNKVLERFAEDVNNAAKRELGSRKIGKNRSYGVASRSLQKSLTYSLKDGQLSFGSPLPYAAFMHWGVNGTRKNRNAPFSFRSKQPPSGPILEWMRAKPVRLRDASGKFVKQTESRLKSAAFLIARSIKRNGIEGLRYYSVALESVVPQYQAELGEALASDILKSLTFKVGPITVKPK
jgi:phage gpG-like protein